MKKILLVNQSVDELDAIERCLKNQNYEIDTALNGYDALIALKKNTYPVVVTSLVLGGYNGEQIVDYIYRKSPLTKCIVYAPMISPVQLKYLYNEHQVFRFYIKPVDLETVVKTGIEDAFLEYDTSIVQQNEEKEHQEWIARQEEMHEEMRSRIQFEKNGFTAMERFEQRLFDYGLKYSYGGKDAKESQILLLLQKKISHKIHALYEMELEDMIQLCILMEQEKKQLGYTGALHSVRDEKLSNDITPKTMKAAYLITWLLLFVHIQGQKDVDFTVNYSPTGRKGVRILFEINGFDGAAYDQALQNMVNSIVQSLSVAYTPFPEQDGTRKYQVLVE